VPTHLQADIVLAPRGITVSRAVLEAAVAEALARREAVLYPYGGRVGLTAAEQAVLREGGADLEHHDLGSQDPVLLATADYAAILASSLTTAEVAERLGVSRTRVWQRLQGPRRSLFGIQTSAGWRVPSFQFTAQGEVPGWAEVVRALPEGLSSVEVFHWFTTPHPGLVLAQGADPVGPRDWLLGGGAPAAVLAQMETLDIP
jgi:hypothetical protein